MAAISVPQTLGPSALHIYRESIKALKVLKKIDPKERYVLLFPDSQAAHVGMGFKTLTCKPAEQVYEQASEFVKKDLLKLCLDGPKSDLLDSMQNRHLATFVTSHATVTKLATEKPAVIPICKASGGVGIGFINTLVFSGAISFENGLDLVNNMGQAMDRAASIVPSARLKVRFMPATSKSLVCRAAREHCSKLGIPEEVAQCSITKQSYAHVLEIAGHEEAIRWLETEGLRLFKFRYIKRDKSVRHAFNTRLMKPVQDYISCYLDQKRKEDPDYLRDPQTCSVYSSTAGRRLRVVKYIMKDLINYPVSPILTEQLLHCLFARPDSLAQPNIYVLWSRRLLQDLEKVNYRAYKSSQLYS